MDFRSKIALSVQSSAFTNAGKANTMKKLQDGVLPSKEELADISPTKALRVVCLAGHAHLIPHILRLRLHNPFGGLCASAEAGRIDLVKYFLDNFSWLSDFERRRAMYAACEKGQTDVVDYLARGGKDDNLMLFISACASGSLPLVMRYDDRMTPDERKIALGVAYREAAKCGSVTVMEYIETKHHFLGDGAIIGACLSGNFSLFKHLQCNPVENKKTAFEAACEGGNPDIVRSLIEWGDWKTALRIGSYYGNVALVEYILLKKFVVDVSEAISSACAGKQLVVLSLLVQHYYSSLDEALASACIHKRNSLVSTILTYGRPTPKPDVGMINACRRLNANALDSLVRAGATNIADGIMNLNHAWKLTASGFCGGQPKITAECKVVSEGFTLRTSDIGMARTERKEKLLKCVEFQIYVGHEIDFSETVLNTLPIPDPDSKPIQSGEATRSEEQTDGKRKPLDDICDEWTRLNFLRKLNLYLACYYTLLEAC